jgi:transcriptional regulator with XRE-family HTH domain
MDCRPDLGPFLRLLRQEGVSLYRISQVSGVNYTGLHRAAKGKSVPDLQTIARIKCALEVILGRPVSLDELVEVRRGR